MYVKKSNMKCSVKGCGYSHYNKGESRQVYSFAYEGFESIIICERCVNKMAKLIKEAKIEYIPRVNSKTGEITMAKKPQKKKDEEKEDGDE